MNRVLALAAVAFHPLVGQPQVSAEEASVPNLKIEWGGPLKVIRETGIGDGTLTLRVTEQTKPWL